jgi:hypothetical protein
VVAEQDLCGQCGTPLYRGGGRPLRACCCQLHRTGPAGPGSSTAEHLPCNQAIGVQFSSRARTLTRENVALATSLAVLTGVAC